MYRVHKHFLRNTKILNLFEIPNKSYKLVSLVVLMLIQYFGKIVSSKTDVKNAEILRKSCDVTGNEY